MTTVENILEEKLQGDTFEKNLVNKIIDCENDIDNTEEEIYELQMRIIKYTVNLYHNNEKTTITATKDCFPELLYTYMSYQPSEYYKGIRKVRKNKKHILSEKVAISIFGVMRRGNFMESEYNLDRSGTCSYFNIKKNNEPYTKIDILDDKIYLYLKQKEISNLDIYMKYINNNPYEFHLNQYIELDRDLTLAKRLLNRIEI